MLMAVAASKTTTASRMEDMSMDLASDHSGSWANSSDVDHESMSPTIASLASAGVLRWIAGRFFELKSAKICVLCLDVRVG
jgi:hypothetical protein